MKKGLAMLTAAAISVSSIAFGSAYAEKSQTSSNEVIYKTVEDVGSDEERLRIQVEDKILDLNSARALVHKGRTMLPFRTIFEALGAKVGFDKASGTILAQFDHMEIQMRVQSQKAIISSKGEKKEVMMSVAPFVKGGQTYVPVRDIADMSGLTVEHAKKINKISIYNKQKLIDEINKNFTIFNSILQTDSFNQSWNNTYRTKTDMTADLKLVIDGETKQAGAKINLEGLSRALDFNGRLRLDVNLGDFEKELENLSEDEKAKIKGLLKSEHQLIIDSMKNILYLKSPSIADFNDNSQDAWLKSDSGIDMDSLERLNTMNTLQSFLSNSEKVTIAERIYQIAAVEKQNSSYSDYSTLYDSVKSTSRLLMLFVGDEGFVKEGNNYTLSLEGKDFENRIKKYGMPVADQMFFIYPLKNLKYKATFTNVGSKNMGLEIHTSGIYTSSKENVNYDFKLNSNQEKAVVHILMDAKSMGELKLTIETSINKTTESISLTPPKGEKIEMMN